MSVCLKPSRRLRTRCTSRWLILATLVTWHGARMTTGSRGIIGTNSIGTANTLGGRDTAITGNLEDLECRTVSCIVTRDELLALEPAMRWPLLQLPYCFVGPRVLCDV